MTAVLDPQSEYLLRNPHFDVLVVTILEVDDAGATNGNPPRIKVGVDEILRGGDRAPAIDAFWRAPIYHEDLEGEAPHQLQPSEAWRTQPLKGPEVGDRLIVFAVGGNDGPTAIESAAAYRYSAANREIALRHMAKERAAEIQIPLFLAMMALPVLSLTLLRRARAAPASAKRPRQTVAALAVVALGLYAYYEAGISAYSDIRIDLLLVWPALIVAVVSGIRATMALLSHRTAK